MVHIHETELNVLAIFLDPIPSFPFSSLHVQIGLPQRMLQRCSSVFLDESHPLHQAMNRTFVRICYQVLTPADLR